MYEQQIRAAIEALVPLHWKHRNVEKSIEAVLRKHFPPAPADEEVEEMRLYLEDYKNSVNRDIADGRSAARIPRKLIQHCEHVVSALDAARAEVAELKREVAASREREGKMAEIIREGLWLLQGEGFVFQKAKAALALHDAAKEPRPCPKIVCLCGSTRFKEAFDEANYQQTMAGRIVLSVGFYMHATGNRHGEGVGATPEQKVALDELHKRKIDMADSVLVLNVGGYIGESTRSEIEYATKLGKHVEYLEPRQ